jgi:hypothetical protein
VFIELTLVQEVPLYSSVVTLKTGLSVGTIPPKTKPAV